MKTLFKMAAFVAASASIIACNKMNEPEPQTEVQTPQTVATKTYGTKTPKVACYVETNDVNPLNAADYYLADGTTFFDMVELFASNIHKDDDFVYLDWSLEKIYLRQELLSHFINDLKEKKVYNYYIEMLPKNQRVLGSIIVNIKLKKFPNSINSRYSMSKTHRQYKR